MEVFYFAGGALALWAVIVSALGIMREGFPGSKGAERAVAVITAILVIGAIGAATIGAAAEEEEGEGEGGEHAALVR